MLESNNVGAFTPFVRIDPVRLYRYTGDYWCVLLVSEVSAVIEYGTKYVS